MQTNAMKIIVLVSNDLSTDMRVHKTCLSLSHAGFHIELIGRKRKSSIPLEQCLYRCKRLNLIVEKGVLFYTIMQIRYAIYLLFNSFDAVYANDLDTLFPAVLIGKIKRKKIIFDSHEYFTEVPELQNSPLKKKIWKIVERFCVARCHLCITVNESIANLFKQEYRNNWLILRNVPEKIEIESAKTRNELEMPEDKFVFILQGSGINIQRGAEEVVEAMKLLNKNAVLYIIGGGDVIDYLKEFVKENELDDKVKILDKMPFNRLMHYTINSNCGITMDKDTNINYRYSLPNKIFDYLNAGIPVLASKLIEIKKIVDTYSVGWIVEEVTPEKIAEVMANIIENISDYHLKKSNAVNASVNFNWQKEINPILVEIKKFWN